MKSAIYKTHSNLYPCRQQLPKIYLYLPLGKDLEVIDIIELLRNLPCHKFTLGKYLITSWNNWGLRNLPSYPPNGGIPGGVSWIPPVVVNYFLDSAI